MYLEHFELNEFPFTLTPNTQYFCALPSHVSALNLIDISLKNGEGFIKIVGEVGIGKTLLCRKILKHLEASGYVTAYIANPNLDSSSIYESILKELGVVLPEHQLKPYELLRLLNSKLLGLYSADQHVVIVIDEAQALSDSLLEELRLLSNLETETSKLLHIVLFGQPELDDHLNKKNLRQLKQRIAFSYYLEPLCWSEFENYVCQRLQKSGCKWGTLFSSMAKKLLFRASSGIPRLINILCHKALLIAYSYDVKKIGVKVALMAIRDTESALTVIKKCSLNFLVIVFLLTVLGFEGFYMVKLFS
jgi:MSHA biogenesis protein MshM